MPKAFIQRRRGLRRREQMDCDLDEQLSSHLEMHVEDNLRARMTPEEARRGSNPPACCASSEVSR